MLSARTKNAKGVTIPSQRRWVLYFINYVMNPQFCPSPNRFPFYKICILKRVRMITIPDFDMGGGCDPYFLIKNTKGRVLYDYRYVHTSYINIYPYTLATIQLYFSLIS